MTFVSPYLLALTAAGAMNARVTDALATGVGEFASWRKCDGMARLKLNLMQLGLPEPTRRQLAEAMSSYMRYFGQAAGLAGTQLDQIDARIIPAGEGMRELICDAKRGPVIMALTHSGNWDLAGVWASRHIAPVTTVAEKVQPERLFHMFASLREQLGMTVIGAQPGVPVFDSLLEQALGRRTLVALLADRDITGRGVRVRMGAADALVGAGPAVAAQRLDAPLYPVHIAEVALGPARAKAAGIKRGYRLWVGERIPVGSVRDTTQAWVDALVPQMKRYPASWHMLQKLFVADLDDARLARARMRAKAQAS